MLASGFAQQILDFRLDHEWADCNCHTTRSPDSVCCDDIFRHVWQQNADPITWAYAQTLQHGSCMNRFMIQVLITPLMIAIDHCVAIWNFLSGMLQ